jgi:hypothetical protein
MWYLRVGGFTVARPARGFVIITIRVERVCVEDTAIGWRNTGYNDIKVEVVVHNFSTVDMQDETTLFETDSAKAPAQTLECIVKRSVCLVQ